MGKLDRVLLNTPAMRSLLMPTETINRDLDFQVLLAARLARPGLKVFLGRRDAIQRVAAETSGGLFIGKAFDPFFPDVDTTFYERMKARDIVVLHLDDEGAVFSGGEREWIATLNARLDPSRISPDDYVCAWGDWQRDVYKSKAPHPANVRTTGHPRFDFLKSERLKEYYAPACGALRERFGDFVLLNTNLTLANNGLGLNYTFTKQYGYDAADPGKRIRAVSFWAHTCKILIHYVQLVHRLADEFPELKIIVRPHPSENHDFYRTVFTGVRNVAVIHEGSVIPWLLTTRALIHDGCTTAIEAALAGVPVINFKSIEDELYDVYLPNLFGTKCSTADEAVAAIRRILQGALSAPSSSDLPIRDRERALFANFEAETLDRLLDVVQEADASQGSASLRGLRIRAKQRIADTIEHGKDVARGIVARGRVERAYSRTKFYGFSNARMDERIENAERVTGTRLRLQLHGDNLLSLTV